MANSAEKIVSTALKNLVPNPDGTFRCYPDVAPDGVAKPYITYQSAGGQVPTALDGKADLQNTRMQVNVWAKARDDAVTLMQSVIEALTAPAIGAIEIGAPVSTYEHDTKLYGSRSDFSIWFYP